MSEKISAFTHFMLFNQVEELSNENQVGYAENISFSAVSTKPIGFSRIFCKFEIQYFLRAFFAVANKISCEIDKEPLALGFFECKITHSKYLFSQALSRSNGY